MRYFNQILVAMGCIYSSITYGLDLYGDVLYWQASESAEWALTNNLNSTNQIVSYQTIGFNFAPGFRVAVGQDYQDWYGRFSYTHYNVGANDSTSGTVISAFELGKFTQKFSDSAQVNFGINYNILDADISNKIQVNEKLLFHPLIGLKGGWINQNINTYYQGEINFTETIQNYFSGIGPKIGLESQWFFAEKLASKYSVSANFSTAFMWGDWYISDSLTQSNSSQLSQLLVGQRDFGAWMADGTIGLKFNYQNYMLKVAYEVSDWFSQYQVFDNTTGARNNDLVLQGVSLGVSGHW